MPSTTLVVPLIPPWREGQLHHGGGADLRRPESSDVAECRGVDGSRPGRRCWLPICDRVRHRPRAPAFPAPRSGRTVDVRPERAWPARPPTSASPPWNDHGAPPAWSLLPARTSTQTRRATIPRTSAWNVVPFDLDVNIVCPTVPGFLFAASGGLSSRRRPAPTILRRRARPFRWPARRPRSGGHLPRRRARMWRRRAVGRDRRPQARGARLRSD